MTITATPVVRPVTEAIQIGENDHGYKFAVGKDGDRWIGFAYSDGVGMFLLPLSENDTVGILDRDKAIRFTGAFVQSPTNGYGGIARWFVEEPLRGKPEDFICVKCGEVCLGDHDDWDFDQ